MSDFFFEGTSTIIIIVIITVIIITRLSCVFRRTFVSARIDKQVCHVYKYLIFYLYTNFYKDEQVVLKDHISGQTLSIEIERPTHSIAHLPQHHRLPVPRIKKMS